MRPRPANESDLERDALDTWALFTRTLDYAKTLSAAVDSKGSYFPGHSEGVAYLVQMIGREAGYDAATMRRLQIAALLHDVGKLMIPDALLLAPRGLTLREYDRMKTHSRHGYRIVVAIAGFEDVADWVLHHHEHVDGTGYPDGLVGEQIPWQSRLLLVADAFHCMTAFRPYRHAMGRNEALAELTASAGRDFDADFVDMLASRPILGSVRSRKDG
jgi:polar amino acid transport system substrate-binding protein